MNKLVIIGAGGHAKVLISILQQDSQNKIIGILEQDAKLFETNILGIKVLGPDDEITRYAPNKVRIVNGVGSVDSLLRRKFIFNKFKEAGYHFYSVIDPSAHVAKDTKLGEGIQIMTGGIIHPGCFIGNNTIINTRVSIDHDCYIEPHVHLAPGAVLSGNVKVGEGAHVGTGAVIIQGIHIGKDSLIGAGAVVIRNVAMRSKMIGVPARAVK